MDLLCKSDGDFSADGLHIGGLCGLLGILWCLRIVGNRIMNDNDLGRVYT